MARDGRCDVPGRRADASATHANADRSADARVHANADAKADNWSHAHSGHYADTDANQDARVERLTGIDTLVSNTDAYRSHKHSDYGFADTNAVVSVTIPDRDTWLERGLITRDLSV